MRQTIRRTAETLMVLAILAVGFYPAVSDAWNRFVANRMIVEYENSVWKSTTDTELQRQKGLAQEYNRELLELGGGIGTKQTQEVQQGYETILDLDGSGIMGYLEIPSILVSLPIYHGTSDEVLARGVGHLEGSSLPIGGTGTHAILSGHRGLPSAELFTNLDELAQGDVFYVNCLGERREYVVSKIRIVLPEETRDLRIEEGKDQVTLVTCTPYGVNTHRLLVTGERSGQQEVRQDTSAGSSENSINGAAKELHRPIWILAVAAAVLLGTVLRLIWIWTIARQREMREERIRQRRKV